MTAICGGGTSSAKPGFGAALSVSQELVGAIFNDAGLAWAVAFAGYMGLINYNASTLCGTDPPVDPGITAADALALISPAGNPGGYAQAVARFSQLIARFAWYSFCQCDSVATPARPAAPAAPSGLPQINPPIVAPLAGLPCWDKTATGQVVTGPGLDMTVALLPPGTLRTGLTAQQGVAAGYPVLSNPLPASKVICTMGAPAFAEIDLMTLEWNATGGIVRANTFAGVIAGDTVRTYTGIPLAPNTAYMGFLYYLPGAGPVGPMTTEITFACAGASVLPPTPCCPPDPVTTALLNQVLGLVTIIQRQLAPFAYIPGTAHAGLSGSGNISVSGLLGCKVNITTLPAALGQSWTNPVEIFDAGFLTWSTADGYPSSLRIDHNPYLSLPARCSAYTNIAYDLHPGVVATITELRREP